jgi:cytidylate kinase
MLTKEGQIYVEEQSQIQRLAKQGSAIFLGHCACEALKEEDGIIKVFIFCSDKEQKQERIMRDYGIKKADVNSVRERFDRKRANYYQANTGGKWKDSANYDIMLDSARLGIDGCVGILEGLLLC